MKRIFAIIGLLLTLVVPPAAAQGVYPAEIKPKVFPPVPVLKPGEKLAPGTIFRDCDTCPDMIVVPPGIFVMGSTKDKNESPTRVIRVSKPFALSRFEVMHHEWQACLDAGGCSHKPHAHGWGVNRMPVMNINHGMAQGFANWLSAKTGKKYRLPSETEWEYAARAGTKTEYWFGDDVGKNKVNCRECGSPWSGIGNGPVGSFDPNP
ncbi:MAG: SUMF1/EgtB/PvdO family nonheme iron enzyme, partial [Proteobacteria bacterium]|nr:SUMF1/EgtB/PvdO family nonheme iron enzyme [Pseudomonadota bacterium]